MKKVIIFIFALIFVMGLVGCRNQTTERVKTIETDLRIYYEMGDGSWECDGHTYKYRLENTGRMHAAVADSTFVYLSNTEDISFDQAWKAAGLSSNANDYFSVEDAILVDIKLG